MSSKENKKPDYIVFGQPRLSEEEISAVADTLRSGWIGTGPRSKEFETAFATYQGVAHAVSVSSCTAALNLCLRAFGIGKGDQVITTSMTFAATVNAIIHAGAEPILVDIDPVHHNLDVEQLAKKITFRTKAVIPVHFAGAPANLDELLRLRKKHGFKLIHDCAHAIETRWNGKPVGGFADATCYSFYSTKNITTIEGGMVCSEDSAFIEWIRLLSYQGMSRDAWKRYSDHGYNHYDIVSNGFKLNMTDVQATLGLCQLKTLEERYIKRLAVWKTYQTEFANTPLLRPSEVADSHRHAHHLYTMRMDPKSSLWNRDQMILWLHSRGIGSGAHYRSIPSMSYYQRALGWNPADYPVSHEVGDTTLSLPLTPYLRSDETARVVDAVLEGLEQAKVDRDFSLKVA